MATEASRERNRLACAEYRRRRPEYYKEWKAKNRIWRQSPEYAALMAPPKKKTVNVPSPTSPSQLPDWVAEGFSMSFIEAEETEISIKSIGTFPSKAHKGAPVGQTPYSDQQQTATTRTSHRDSFLEATIADDVENGEEVTTFETPGGFYPPNSYAVESITVEPNEDGLWEAVEAEGTVTVKVADNSELAAGEYDVIVCINFLPTNPNRLAKAPQVESRQQKVRITVEEAV